jgi:predicted GNAT family acetyltransferase
VAARRARRSYSGMDSCVFDDPQRFLDAAGPYLSVDPFTTNVIAVHTSAVVNGARPRGSTDIWITVEDGGEVRALAMHTPPYNLFLSRMPDPAVKALAQTLAGAGRTVPGVSGERASVGAFTDAWVARTRCSWRPEMSMRMYVLETLIPPADVSGRARRGVSDDAPLVASWLSAFHHEAEPTTPAQDWDALVPPRVERGEVIIWDDRGEAVSMAFFSPPAVGVSRIGPVYTPPPRRRHGYASAVTAAASSASRAAGASHVVLYTDLSNPTSNGIYRAIGYRPHHDADMRRFD